MIEGWAGSAGAAFELDPVTLTEGGRLAPPR